MDTPPDKKSVPSNLPGAEMPEPEKYIRTFESDMEILKKGGVPQLQPLVATPPPSTLEVAEPTPEPVAEVVTPPNPPLPPPPLVAKPVPRPLPPVVKPVLPPPPPPPRPVATAEINASPLQTYTSDFLQKVKDTRASTATVLAAEQDAGASKPADAAKTPALSIVSITAGVLLLLLGGAGVYLGYTRYAVQSLPVVLEQKVSAPIVVDDREKIEGGSATAIRGAIVASIARTLPAHNVRLLYTELATTTGNSVFSLLRFPAPDVLLRNVVAAKSMAGVVNVAGVSSPFFILSVTSYPDTFAGMLSWEETILRDVAALFPAYPEVIHSAPLPPPVATTTATTTPAKKGSKTSVTPKAVATSTPPVLPPPALVFRDEVVSNHDVRVYRDAEGRSVLVYGYWNKSTLVIARDFDAFGEILSRLAAAP